MKTSTKLNRLITESEELSEKMRSQIFMYTMITLLFDIEIIKLGYETN